MYRSGPGNGSLDWVSIGKWAAVMTILVLGAAASVMLLP